ncbi:MAG: hypothetical protein AB7O04_07330 [Hyphomonadaceae bacterium]
MQQVEWIDPGQLEAERALAEAVGRSIQAEPERWRPIPNVSRAIARDDGLCVWGDAADLRIVAFRLIDSDKGVYVENLANPGGDGKAVVKLHWNARCVVLAALRAAPPEVRWVGGEWHDPLTRLIETAHRRRTA